MSLPKLSIKRPVLTIVMNVAIVLFGVIGFTYLGVREFPSIDPAIISVRTSYTGANPDIIESQITEPLEKEINSIDGIRNISSTSSQGSSNINIEFNLDKDLEAAANDVRDKVSQAVRRLPQDIDAPPVVSKADADSQPIIAMTVQSKEKNVLELSDYAEISTAAANTTPNSRKRLPTKPSRKITGRNTAARVTEMEITAYIISSDPFMAA